MTQQLIDLGTVPNDGTGDPLRTMGEKANENFSELYLALTNTVLAKDKSDMGTLFVGVRTLAADTKYLQIADIDMGTDVIRANPTPGSVNVIRSTNTSGFTFAYSGTGSMFTDSELATSLFCNEMQISTPNGTVCNIQDTTASGTGTILFFTCQFLLCQGMGTIEDVRFISFFSQRILCGHGWTWTNCVSVTYNFPNDFFGLNLTSTVFNTIQGNNGPISYNGGFYGPLVNEAVFYIDPSSTTTGGIVSIDQFDTSGGGTLFAPGSKDHTDLSWKFIGSQGGNNQDSSVTTVARLSANVTATDIPDDNAWIRINQGVPTPWDGSLLERGTLSIDGVFTYTGFNNTKLSIDGNFSAQPDLAATRDISITFVNIHAHTNFTVTFDNTTNIINETATARIDGDAITFPNTAGTLPTGLRGDAVYYVRDKTVDSYRVAYTAGGTAIAFPDDGTPVNSYNVCDLSISSDPKEPISGNNPRDLRPTALAEVETGDQIAAFTQNKNDAIDVLVDNAYFKVIRA